MVPLVKEKNEDERICSLDGLRGLAALAVVAFHYTGGGLHRLLPGGQFVTLFFILSGLVLSIAPLRVGTGSYDWPRYQLRRIVRLAVPTCSAVGACCIVSTVTVRTGWEAPGYAAMFAASPPSEWLHDLLTQLDMLSMTTAGSRVDGSVLAMVDLPSWSMCWELLFSLALPIYVVIATDMRIVAPVVLACVLVAEWAQWPPLRHMAVFALGVALARSLVDRGAGVDAEHRRRPRRAVRCRSDLPERSRRSAGRRRPASGRVRMPSAGGGRARTQRGVGCALHRARPLAGTRLLQPVSGSSARARLARAIHPRARRAAPGTADSAVPAGSGGVPPSRGAPGDHAIEKAGEINIPLASSRQGEYGGFTTRAHLRRPWNMRL